MDRNTVQFMMDEMQEKIDQLRETLALEEAANKQTSEELAVKNALLMERNAMLDEKDRQLEALKRKIEELKSNNY